MNDATIVLIMVIIMYVIGILVGTEKVPFYIATLMMGIIGFLTSYLF